jgi:outer membrane protein OmpA-like peptidoglycan-associated protein
VPAVVPPTSGPAQARESAARAGDAGDAMHADEFERLCELLLGAERRELAAANARIAELEARQQDLPQRLPGAAVEALRSERGNPRIREALSEPVAQALGSAVQKNRQGLVDALFPILGPMIRKSIAEALRSLVGNLNSAIESSLTPRGLKWRLEAWRGGVPYAQVVLRHRLAYGIDHLFLIERESGLVMHHASAPGLPPLDADAIAGMLTALGDFVDDSIGGDSGGALESAQVGEYLVWLEHGPRANLACFMHGVPPAELRTVLKQRLEDVHAQLPALAEGADARAIGEDAFVRQVLEPAAVLQELGTRDVARAAPAASRWPVLLVLLAALLAFGWFALERQRWNQRIDDLHGRLSAHPGFALTSIQSRPWRMLAVRGLLDPDADPLAPVLDGAGLGAVEARLETTGYVSTADVPLARRAARLLAPPEGIRLAATARTLRIEGHAPEAWIERARERAGWIPGVAAVAFEAVPDVRPAPDTASVARRQLDEELVALSALHVAFAEDLQPAAGAAGVVERYVQALRRARELAATAGVELVARVIGTTDASGSEGLNTRLREQRARWLADALAARGIDGLAIEPAVPGVGAPGRRGAQLRVIVEEGGR